MRNVKSICLAFACAWGVLGAAATGANAASVTYTGTNGSNLSASAAFSIVGGNLQIVLTNTSTTDVMNTAQLLTGVYFNISGQSSALTPVSASAAGSTLFYYATPTTSSPGGNVGG